MDKKPATDIDAPDVPKHDLKHCDVLKALGEGIKSKSPHYQVCKVCEPVQCCRIISQLGVCGHTEPEPESIFPPWASPNVIE